MGNKNLHVSRAGKTDEFYTQTETVESELGNYWQHFAGKVVLCNCDDPYESEFFKYFARSFNELKLKKLIATCYADSPVVQTELNFWGTPNENPAFDKKRNAIRFDVTEVPDLNGDGAIDLDDVKLLLENNRNVVTYLNGDGDFRSPECLAALKEADIVVTNPPFSLFREYVAQLVNFDKKFLIIGNKNAVTYKEIFPLIMQNKIWLGCTSMSREFYFNVPQKYIDAGLKAGKDRSIVFHDGKYVARSQATWFTNLDFTKRHEPLTLFRRYSPEEYPRYDNYDAIEVSRTVDIPKDYFGVMGVPISFLDKHCPEQFKILGATESEGTGFSNGLWHDDSPNRQATIDGKKIYKRLLIRKISDIGDLKDED